MFLRCAVGTVLGIAAPAVSLAQAEVDEAQRHFDEADFEGALESLSEAEANAELTAPELGHLYELRALTYRAMRQPLAMETALRCLLVVDPEHELAESVPPEVHQRFATLRSQQSNPIVLELVVDRSEATATVAANVFNDELGLVRQVRVGGRVQDGVWASLPGPVDVPARRDQPVEYYAEAIGPGGVILVREASVEFPLVDDPQTPRAAVEPLSPWVWAGIAAAALVVIGGFFVLSASADSGGGSGFQTTLPTRAGLVP